MIISNIINILKNFISFLLFFSLVSCTYYQKEEIIKDDIEIEKISSIELSNSYIFDLISNHWDNINFKNHNVNYNFDQLLSFDFGKGEKNINYLISNPILTNNYLFLVDNEAILTKYDIPSNTLIWQKKVNENIQKNVASPVSLLSTNDSIIITTGEGTVTSLDYDGNLNWTKNFDNTIKTASYIINDTIFIATNDGQLNLLNSIDGSVKINFNKEINKIPSYYGGKFLNYKNNLIFISPKQNIYFIDNFLFEYSELDSNFFRFFEPIDQYNFDYNIDIFTYSNYLIIIENNEFYSLFNTIENSLDINQYQIPKSKYLKLINNSIISLDKENILRAINYQNTKMFWKNNINKNLGNSDIVDTIIYNNNIFLFLDNGKILILDKNNGEIIQEIKLKINNIKSLYFHKDYIVFINNKAKVYLYK